MVVARHDHHNGSCLRTESIAFYILIDASRDYAGYLNELVGMHIPGHIHRMLENHDGALRRIGIIRAGEYDALGKPCFRFNRRRQPYILHVGHPRLIKLPVIQFFIAQSVKSIKQTSHIHDI